MNAVTLVLLIESSYKDVTVTTVAEASGAGFLKHKGYWDPAGGITQKGACLVEGMKQLPEPVQEWVMP